MVNREYQSSVRWFLEKPWRGNAPTGPVRAQLSSLQAALVQLFNDFAASNNPQLTLLGVQLSSQYIAVFQEESSKSMLGFAEILSQAPVIIRNATSPDLLAPVTQSLKRTLVQLIDLAMTRQDEELAQKVLDIVNELKPREAEADRID